MISKKRAVIDEQKEIQKAKDKEIAIEIQNRPNVLEQRRVDDQESRGAKLSKFAEIYKEKVIPRQQNRLLREQEIIKKNIQRKEAKENDQELRKSQRKDFYKQQMITDLNRQREDNRVRQSAEIQRQKDLDKATLQKAIDLDERQKEEKRLRQQKQKEIARQAMLDMVQKNNSSGSGAGFMQNGSESMTAAANQAGDGWSVQTGSQAGASKSRGERMTAEELKLNSELLRSFKKAKREGKMDDIFQKCVSKKITTYD